MESGRNLITGGRFSQVSAAGRVCRSSYNASLARCLLVADVVGIAAGLEA